MRSKSVRRGQSASGYGLGWSKSAGGPNLLWHRQQERPRCGLSIWLSLLVIFNTLFWVYANFIYEKTDKTRKYLKSAIFVWCKNGRRRFIGAQQAFYKYFYTLHAWFTSGSSALLGRPRCGLSSWLLLLALFHTLFWVYANIFHEKTDKTRK